MIEKEMTYYNCCRLKYNKEAKALFLKEVSNNCNQNIWSKERETFGGLKSSLSDSKVDIN